MLDTIREYIRIYIHIWKEISWAYFEIAYKGKSNKEKADALLQGMSKKTDFYYEPDMLQEGIIKYWKDIKDTYFDHILSKDLRDDTRISSVLIETKTEPTEKLLEKMIESHNKDILTWAFRVFPWKFPENKKGQEALLKQLLVQDFVTVRSALENLSKYLHSKLPEQRKEEIFNQVDKRLRELQKNSEQGKYFYKGDKTGYGEVSLVDWFLKRAIKKAPDFVKKHIPAFGHHVNWMQKRAKEIDNEYFLKKCERYKKTLESLKK